MRLIHKSTGDEVMLGDQVHDREGDKATIVGVGTPHNAASTGRVVVKWYASPHEQAYYPEVFGCEWIEREDRDE